MVKDLKFGGDERHRNEGATATFKRSTEKKGRRRRFIIYTSTLRF